MPHSFGKAGTDNRLFLYLSEYRATIRPSRNLGCYSHRIVANTPLLMTPFRAFAVRSYRTRESDALSDFALLIYSIVSGGL